MPPTIRSSSHAILRAWYFLLLLCASVPLFLPHTTHADNTGLVGYWSFNEGTGAIATDFSGNGNHGTLIDFPIWTNGK